MCSMLYLNARRQPISRVASGLRLPFRAPEHITCCNCFQPGLSSCHRVFMSLPANRFDIHPDGHNNPINSSAICRSFHIITTSPVCRTHSDESLRSRVHSAGKFLGT